jgi:glycosyltransferase involved in cell wall biosynthesis
VLQRTYFRLTARDYPARVSLVIPVFNEAEVLPLLQERLSDFMNNLAAASEVILVNDGSSDRTLEVLLDWVERDERITLINLARNFGHQAAVTAGLDHATGDAIVIMDADLQDPPEVIYEMLVEYCRGYDVVYGKRIARRGESFFKQWSAWAFYRVMRMIIHHELPADVGDFRLISRRCLDVVTSMRETHRFLRGMISWVGFPQTEVAYTREPRAAGATKYPIWKMLKIAWTAAISFSPLPLRLSFGLGVLLALVGITQAINALIRTALGLYTVPGWTSLMVVVCLIGSAILISIGVLGEYVGRIFEESKGRPLYIVAESVNAKSNAPVNTYAENSSLTRFE